MLKDQTCLPIQQYWNGAKLGSLQMGDQVIQAVQMNPKTTLWVMLLLAIAVIGLFLYVLKLKDRLTLYIPHINIQKFWTKKEKAKPVSRFTPKKAA